MNNINYYKKYLKYKQKYLKYKYENIVKNNLVGGGVELWNSEKKNYIIPIKNFGVEHIDSVQEFINKFDSDTINCLVENINLIVKDDIVIGIIPYNDNKFNDRKILDNRVERFIKDSIDKFIQENNFMTKAVADKELMRKLFDVDKNQDKIINFIKEKYPDKDEAYKFIKCHINRYDMNKNIIFYAVRLGKVDLLEWIKTYIEEENFRKLMETRDIEGRTPFMISTHAYENPEYTFFMIKHFTPDNIIYAYDNGNLRSEEKYSMKKLNALGWYNLRKINNVLIHSELERIFGDKEFL
jgi:hypothetical protein